MARETKVVGKDASIAPSTLEKGLVEVRPTKVRRGSTSKTWKWERKTKVHPEVWKVVGPQVKQGRFIKINSPTDVWVLNRPAEEMDWDWA